MNDLYIDYNPYKHVPTTRKRFLRIIGVLMIGFGLFLLFTELKKEGSLSFMISAGANILLGITIILQTFQFKVFNPMRFIHVDEDFIEYRFWNFRKKVTIEWNSVKGIQNKPFAILFEMSNDQTVLLNLKFQPSSDVKRITPLINSIAQKKNLIIT